jgi:Uma2 family endonuclease
MTAERKPFYTIEEYLALEKSSEEKYEYWEGQIFCMSGGSQAHSDIGDNIFRILSSQLVGRKCRAMSGAMPVKTSPVPPYKYPDGSVTCGEREFEKIDGIDVLTNPTLLLEVLSPNTERIDRGPKFTLYKSISSFKEYLLISQDEARIIQFVKQDDGEWKADVVMGLDNKIYLPTIDCTLTLSDVYQDVKLKVEK